MPGEVPTQVAGLAVSHDEGATWQIDAFPAPAGFAPKDVIAVGGPVSSDGTSFRVAVAYGRDDLGAVEIVGCQNAVCDRLGLVSEVVYEGGLLSMTSDVIFVGAGSGILRSDDEGRTWRSIRVDLGGSIAEISFRSAEDGLIDVVDPAGTFTVYLTTDAGGHWTPVLHHG
jgi:hypothetical protein